jgi:hypothetical protein
MDRCEGRPHQATKYPLSQTDDGGDTCVPKNATHAGEFYLVPRKPACRPLVDAPYERHKPSRPRRSDFKYDGFPFFHIDSHEATWDERAARRWLMFWCCDHLGLFLALRHGYPQQPEGQPSVVFYSLGASGMVQGVLVFTTFAMPCSRFYLQVKGRLIPVKILLAMVTGEY